VLDVGCGPGTITADLATRVAPGRVTAVEPTETALQPARVEATARGHDTIGVAVADVHALGFPDATFDSVHGAGNSRCRAARGLLRRSSRCRRQW
jgi:ubiquinone/menaquinone biosynthesis C-methylase UbiE